MTDQLLTEKDLIRLLELGLDLRLAFYNKQPAKEPLTDNECNVFPSITALEVLQILPPYYTITRAGVEDTWYCSCVAFKKMGYPMVTGVGLTPGEAAGCALINLIETDPAQLLGCQHRLTGNPINITVGPAMIAKHDQPTGATIVSPVTNTPTKNNS